MIIIKNSQKGITLIEIMVILSIISIITGITISDFPKMKTQLGLNRVVYMIFQDVKNAQGLSGSGFHGNILEDPNIVPLGYGVFIDLDSLGNKKYLVYADINGDNQYNFENDYIIKEVDFSFQEKGIIIKEIKNAPSRLSINFSPPNFDTKISNLYLGHDNIEIIVAIDTSLQTTRSVYINKVGLIEVK